MSCVARIPFTIILLMVLIVAGIYGRTHMGPIDERVHGDFGHSPQLLWAGGVYRLITSPLLTAGGVRFYASLFMLGIAVGWAELQFGFWKTLLVFVGIHLTTLLIMFGGIALALSLIESHRGHLLWYARDVGPSAGYYGCLGLAITSLSPQIRTVALVTIISILAIRLGWSAYHLPEEGRVLSADIAHLIAFPLGTLLWRWC